MSTLKTTNLQHASAASPAIVLAADGSATAQLSSINGGPLAGSRNRIINGDMRIDARNNGASVTLSNAENRFPADRWAGFNDTDGTVTAQQVAEAPAGFTNSSKLTVTTADASIGATQRTTFRQRIEGLNVSDLGWGTSSAQAVTISFWVRSSVTGTHGGSIMNSGADYSYPFTYVISAANTWEFITVTIAGPTVGTWLTTNGIGLQLIFGLAIGSTYSGPAGAWAATRYEGATGAAQVTSTLNATWQITGVQLEAGSVATPFERRSYGQELSLCRRYFEPSGYAMGTSVTNSTMDMIYCFEVEKRTDVTYVLVNGTGAVAQSSRAATNITSVNSAFRLDSRKAGFRLNVADTGLNVGSACFAIANGAFAFSAEL